LGNFGFFKNKNKNFPSVISTIFCNFLGEKKPKFLYHKSEKNKIKSLIVDGSSFCSTTSLSGLCVNLMLPLNLNKSWFA
jgi:hypothetical protein